LHKSLAKKEKKSKKKAKLMAKKKKKNLVKGYARKENATKNKCP